MQARPDSWREGKSCMIEWWRIERILALRTGASTAKNTFPRGLLCSWAAPRQYRRPPAARRPMGPAPEPCLTSAVALGLGQAMAPARFRAPECKLGRRAARGRIPSPNWCLIIPAAARGARPPSSSAAGMRCRPRASRPRSALLIGHLAVTIAAMRLVGLGRGATPVPFFMA